MAEEKQTPEVTDTLTQDDMDMLRAVLKNEHTRGVMPVSVYNQSEMLVEE